MSETPIERKRRKRREEYVRNASTYAAYRKEYAPRRRELMLKYHDSLPLEQLMLWSAKSRAARNGVEFTITLSDIVMPEVCPLLGIKLQRNKNRGRPSANSPTLDRKDSRLGYTKENVWVISNKANRAKNNLSLEELELLVTNMRRHSE